MPDVDNDSEIKGSVVFQTKAFKDFVKAIDGSIFIKVPGNIYR